MKTLQVQGEDKHTIFGTFESHGSYCELAFEPLKHQEKEKQHEGFVEVIHVPLVQGESEVRLVFS